MHFFKNYNEQIIKQDFINKFKFNSNKSLPKLKKITLNFGCRNFTIQKFAVTALALEILTLKKSSVTTAKTPNLLLKIQKGQAAGCKVELQNDEIYSFMTRLNLELLPKLKNFSGLKIEKQLPTFFFQIPGHNIMLKEFENQYPLFKDLPALDVNVLTNSKNSKEIFFLAKSSKLPFLGKRFQNK
jgi:ribosomal protein L5